MAELLTVDKRIDRYRKVGTGLKRERSLLASPHIVPWEDEFLGDVVDTKYTITAAGSAGSGAIVVGSDGGVFRLAAGSDDDGIAMIELGRNFKGDLNAIASTRVKLAAITDVKFVFGFTDALLAGDAAGPVNILSTPSMTASDAAVWVLDTDDTGNLELQAIAVKGGTIFSGGEGDAKAIQPSVGIPTSGAVPIGPTFTAGEYLTLTVALRGDQVRFISEMDAADIATTGGDEPYFDSGWIGDGVSPGTPAGIEGGTLVTPIIHSVTRNGGSNTNVDIDYLHVYQSRV